MSRREEWYWNYLYRGERERSLDFIEDLYHPLDCAAELAPGASMCLIASVESLPNIERDSSRAFSNEQERTDALLQSAAVDPVQDPMGAQLVIAADQFLVERALTGGEQSLTVIAGIRGSVTGVEMP